VHHCTTAAAAALLVAAVQGLTPRHLTGCSFGMSPCPEVSLSLVILLAGIGTATMTDVQLNPLGSFFGELLLDLHIDL
jgi:glycopeptide antibiotics resistance protein